MFVISMAFICYAANVSPMPFCEYVYFSVRILSVLRGHSASPTSKDFLSQILSITFFFYLASLFEQCTTLVVWYSHYYIHCTSLVAFTLLYTLH